MQPQSFAGTEDTTLSGQLVASDPGDTLTFSVSAAPASGTLAMTPTGSFTFVPAPDFSGAMTFQARATDSAGQSATATITLNLAGVNDAPVATDDVLEVTSTSALAILANDVDVDGDALTITVTSTPLVGTASVNTDGTVALGVPAGFRGMTRFTYRITDPAGLSSEATAVVFVGIAPFKAIFHTHVTSAGAPTREQVFVNDFLRTYRAHPDLSPGEAGWTATAADGSALALSVEFRASGERQLRYVDLARPGEMRDMSGMLGFSEVVLGMWVSGDGRYVIYQQRTAAGEELWLFDAHGTTQATRLADPAQISRGSQVKFNAANSRAYFVGRTQLTQSSSVSSVFRVDLATRAITRVTPVVPGESGLIDSYLVTPDESRVVVSRSLPNLPRAVYVTAVAQPDVEALLHAPLAAPEYAWPPAMSPDGAVVLFQTFRSAFDAAQVLMANPLTPGATTPVGGAGFQQSVLPIGILPPFSMRADSAAALVLSGCSTDSNPNGRCDAYEVSFDAPATPVRVNLAVTGGEQVRYPQYSSDGSRIVYTRSTGLNASQLQVTRREALGIESIPLTPVEAPVQYYVLDAAGYSALAYLQTGELMLVNLDAPQLVLPVGEGTGTLGSAELLPR